MTDPKAYVFAYGSLVNENDWVMKEIAGSPVPGSLLDTRRTWKVAIENASPAYDHKHYLTEDGLRPRAVATLGIYSSPGSFCNGLALPVTEELLEKIDRREKSYNRKEVSDLFTSSLAAPLFTYYPKERNLNLWQEERARILLPESYLLYCQEAFQKLGAVKLFWQSTDPIPCPVADLFYMRLEGESGI